MKNIVQGLCSEVKKVKNIFALKKEADEQKQLNQFIHSLSVLTTDRTEVTID